MSSICQPTVLNSPLQEWIMVESWKTWKEKLKPRNKRVKGLVAELDTLDSLNPFPQRVSYFCQNLQSLPFMDNSTIPKEPLEELRDLIMIAIPIVSTKCAKSKWSEEGEIELRSKLHSVMSHRTFPLLQRLYYWKWWYENIIVATARPDSFTKANDPPEITVTQNEGSTVSWSTISENGLEIDCTRSLCHIEFHGKHWFVSREHLLMLGDSAAQRFNCFLSSILAEILGDRSIVSPELLMSISEWGDSIIGQLFNEGYRAIKFWEPLMIATLLCLEDDPHVNVTHFREQVQNDFINSVPHHADFLRDMLAKLQNLIMAAVDHGDKSALTQLFGIYRFWGHPTVSGVMGVSQLRKITQQRRATDQTAIRNVTHKWREYFTISYYHKHGRLPDMKKTRLKDDSYLCRCLLRNELPILTHPDYAVNDWRHVKFEGSFSVPERLDFSDLIADKATSLGFDDLIHRCEKFGDIGPGADRSVIIRWLKEEYVSPRDFLHQISLHGFGEDEIVAGVFPKEREGKNEPRLFGIMTLKKRLYIVITEALLSEFILPLFPEITMTFDSVTLTQRLYSCTKRLNPEIDKQQSVNIVTNLDFQKWNSYMREEETLQIFTDFDDLFGFSKVFSRSHELFTNCWFYLADGSITPKFDRNRRELKIEPGVWTDHLGGIEGLRQKGWTIFTIVILRMVSDKMNVRTQLLGQGDNQVLINAYYPRPGMSIREQHITFMDVLNRTLDSIGPPLKMEESWTSSKFFIYGKTPIYEGIPLPMSLKKTCRMHRLNNDGVVNLDGTLSSISANASAAVNMSNYPIIPYFIAQLETAAALMLFLERPFYGKNILSSLTKTISVRVPIDGVSMKITERTISALKELIRDRKRTTLYLVLSVFPSALGGYPCVQWSDLILRGFPDPVTSSIWELKLLLNGQINPEAKSWILKLLSPRLHYHINPELLCMDPTGLNLLKGSRPKDKIKHFVVEFLVTMPGIRNQQFHEFLRLAVLDQSPLSQALFAMDPCHPRVMSEVYNSTVQGRASQCVRKIDKTPVLLNLMCKNHDQSRKLLRREGLDEDWGDLERNVRTPKVLGKIFYSFEVNQISGMMLTLNSINYDPAAANQCSVLRAAFLREQSWKKELCGVTVAFPRELIHPLNHNEDPPTGYITVTTVSQVMNYDYMKDHLGCFKPYLGSTSKEKVEYEGSKIVSIGPSFMVNATKCLRLINWGTERDSKLSELIMKIFSQFTDADPISLLPKVGTVTGTLEHRVADLRTSHSGTLSVPYTISTHVTINTNRFRPGNMDHLLNYSNYNLNFQALFSFIAGEMVLSGSLGEGYQHCKRMGIHCHGCLIGVNEDMIDIDDEEKADTAMNCEALNERSDFMWTSKNDLERCAARSNVNVNLSDTQGMDEDESMMVCPIDAEEIDRDPRSLLSLTIIRDLMSQHPIYSSSSWDWLYEESTSIVPVAIIPQLRIVEIFDHLAAMVILKTIFIRSQYWTDQPSGWINEMYEEERTVICTTFPRKWFKSLTSCFLFDDIYHAIRDHYPGVNPPIGTPPSQEEKAHCLHDIFVFTVARRMTKPTILQMIKSFTSSNLPLSLLPCFHPQVLYILKSVFSHRGKTYRNKDLSLLSWLRGSEGKRDGLSNQISVISEVVPQEDGSKVLKKSFIDLKRSRGIPSIQSFPRPAMVSADWVAKSIQKKVTVPSTIPDLSSPDLKVRSIMSLPNATQHMVVRVPSPEKERSLSLLPRELETTPSPINSLYKTPIIVTSAPYKLLSVLRDVGQDVGPNISDFTQILCSGDGSGGFSVLLAHLCPRSTVIYNSLFDHQKLSSVGIDRFVPAAYVISGVDPSRIIGLDHMEQGESDLTSEKFVTQTLSEIRGEIQMIVCDAEGEGYENPGKILMITSNLIKISRAKNTQVLLLKTYTKRVDIIIAQVSMISCVFSSIRLIRSRFSGYGNTEVYLYCYLPITIIHRELGFAVDNEGVITLRGNLGSESELKGLARRVEKAFDYHATCRDISEDYTSFLSCLFPKEIESSIWMFLSLATQSFANLRAHPEVMSSIRSMFTPVKFSEEGRIVEEFYLTIANIRKIALFYLSTIIASLPDDMIIDIHEHIKHSHLMIYENVMGSWSLAVRINPKLCHNYKSWTLPEIMEDKSYSKRIFSVARQIREYCHQRGMTIIPQVSILPPQSLTTCFPTDGKMMFEGISYLSIPLSEMPALGTNQHHYAPREYSATELSILCSDLDVGVGPSTSRSSSFRRHFPWFPMNIHKIIEDGPIKKCIEDGKRENQGIMDSHEKTRRILREWEIRDRLHEL